MRRRTILIRWILAPALAAAAPACREGPPRGPAGKPFRNLEAAVRAGVVAPELIDRLAREGRVEALVVLDVDPPEFTVAPDRRPEAQYAALLDRYTANLRFVKGRLAAAVPGMERLRDYDALPVAYVQLTARDDLLQLINDAVVRAVTVDVMNELYLAQTLGLIGATRTILWTERGVDTEVALLDTGADLTLSAFGTCPTAGAPTCRISVAQDFGGDDGAPDASNSQHGTRMASVILAVAPDARVLALDVTRVGTDATVRDSDALAALDFVVNQTPFRNIRAVSISWGHKEHWTRECGASWFWRNPYVVPVALLRSLGVNVVAATGNHAVEGSSFTNGVSYPACTPGMIRVGAVYDANLGRVDHQLCSDPTTAPDQVVCMSQTGPLVSLFAPGSEITLAGFGSFSGTSLASPQVAAALAVLSAFEPGRSAQQHFTTLTSVGPSVTDSRAGVTRRRLDIRAALKSRVDLSMNAFASAAIVTGPSARVDGVNWDATREPGEPAHAGNPGGASVWYRWQPTYAGTARVTTAGSNFNTLLAVYTGTALSALVPVAANDDEAPTVLQSAVTFTVTAGTTYVIAVDGKGVGSNPPEQGRLVLNINASPPSNDAFATAQVLSLGVVAGGTNFGASREPQEPFHCGNDGGASVWYVWEATATGRFQVRTSSPAFHNRCVSVYRATSSVESVGTLMHVAGDLWAAPGDIWNASFDAVANTRYFIVVEGMSPEQPGYGPARGTFTVSIGT